MATANEIVTRLNRSRKAADVVLRAALVKANPEADGKAITRLVAEAGKPINGVPAQGDAVTFAPMFEGTPFAGVTGTVTRPNRKVGKAVVIVALASEVGGRSHYAVPAGYVVKSS